MLQAVGGIIIDSPRGEFVGVFGADYLGVGDGDTEVESSALIVTCRSSDVTRLSLQKGDGLRADGQDYVIVGHQPDGTGITTLRLHHA